MVQHNLSFVAASDTTATFVWGADATGDLTNPFVYNQLGSITFSNLDTIVIDDDDATFDDDDGRSWSTHGNASSGLQTLVGSIGGVASGTAVEAEMWIDLETPSGDPYRVIVVSEVDAGGNIVGIFGYVFDGAIPPMDTTLTFASPGVVDHAITGFDDIASPPVCFTPGTMIRTINGDRAIETLAVGDMVLTIDHGYLPIKLIAQTTFNFDEPATPDQYKPILISAGALGDASPLDDLIVSPQHRILMHDTDQNTDVLVPAKALTGKQGIRVMKGKRKVTYIHLVMEGHEVIVANGAKTESFFAGPEALKSVNPTFRRALYRQFPELSSDPATDAMQPPRPFLRVQDAQKRVSSLRAVSSTSAQTYSNSGSQLHS